MIRTLVIALGVTVCFVLTPDWLFKIGTIVFALLLFCVLVAYLNGLKSIKIEKHYPCGCKDCVRAGWDNIHHTDDFWDED